MAIAVARENLEEEIVKLRQRNRYEKIQYLNLLLERSRSRNAYKWEVERWG